MASLNETKFGMAAVLPIPGYQIERKIAEGGTAEVYEGRESMGSRKVAIKVLHTRLLESKPHYRRIVTEGEIGLKLPVHPHVAETISSGKAGGRPYVVLELILGRTLREVIRDQKIFNDREIFRIAKAVGQGMKFLHDRKVFHKDMKPENVMLDEDSLVKIIDLGFSEMQSGLNLNLFGRRLDGSPAYMAPEYIQTKKPTPATDLYALGCTLYEAATGRPPLVGASDHEVIAKQLNMNVRPTPVGDLNKDLSPFTQRLIMTALEKDTKRRFKSMEEFLLELHRNPHSSANGTSGSRHVVPAGWAVR